MIHRTDAQLNLDQIIFENRNKYYGAFFIRNAYNSHLKVSFFLIFTLVISLSLSHYLLRNNDASTYFKNKAPIVLDPDIMHELEFVEKPKTPVKAKPTLPKIPSAPQTKVSNSSFKISHDPDIKESPFVIDTAQYSSITDNNEIADGSKNGNGGLPSTIDSTSFYNELFTYVDVMPSFPGGDKALSAYVLKNLKFPFVDENISGKVYVQFTIAANGDVSDVHIVKGIHPDFDNEADRVIKKMPTWIPGKYKGRAVKVKKILPINFRID